VAEPLSKLRGTSARQKKYRTFLKFELAAVTSQALKYDVINFCQRVQKIQQFYAKFDKPSMTPIPTSPYLSYATLT